jgi:hypothetical protein
VTDEQIRAVLSGWAREHVEVWGDPRSFDELVATVVTMVRAARASERERIIDEARNG